MMFEDYTVQRDEQTQADAAVLQQVAQVVEHRALILTADSTEITQETTAVGHHAWETDLLQKTSNILKNYYGMHIVFQSSLLVLDF